MIVCFRVDASFEIGTGHVIRCLTLAEALRSRGAQCVFICREHDGNFLMHISERGFDVRSLPLDRKFKAKEKGLDESIPFHSGWLGTDWNIDAEQTKNIIGDINIDWLIVDHYALDARWELALRQKTNKILVIDDIADRKHDCDVLLDQNLYADMQTRYVEKVPIACRLLLGPRYALLRDEFKILHEKTKPRSGKVKRVLIFFGGIDISNYTGGMLNVLAQIDIPDLHIDVVIGAHHPCREEIRELCEKVGFFCHIQTDQMAALMSTADLAIGAGGSACWERCCLGLPALLVALADNQIQIAKTLDLFGACIYVGAFETISPLVLGKMLKDIIKRQTLMADISRKAYSLVDGQGIDRVCEEVRY